MARQDMDIKGDVIGELEDIIDPRLGVNLLDALLVDELTVNKGQVRLLMTFDAERPETERDSLKAQIQDILFDVEGVEGVAFETMERAEAPFITRDQLSTPAAPAPPKPASAPTPQGEQFLTLGSLLGAVDPEEVASQPDAPADEGLTLYSGGGCAAGTVPDFALNLPKARTAPAPEPPRSPTPATQASSPAPATPAPQPPRPAAPPVASASGNTVTVELEVWNELLAQRRALEVRLETMEERVRALQGALRALIDG